MVYVVIDAHLNSRPINNEGVGLLSAGFPFIEVIGGDLAVEEGSADPVARFFLWGTWSSYISIGPIVLGRFLIHVDVASRLEEASRTEISKVILFFIIDVEVEVISGVSIWVFDHVGEVEGPGLEMDWQESLWVEVGSVETWWFTLVSGQGSDDVGHADWLLGEDISSYLPLLLVDVSKKLPSNDALISINDCVESHSIGSQALIDIWNMGD